MKWIVNLGFIGAGALLGALAFLTLAHQLWAAEDYRSELPPCFEVGSPFHHRFRPECSGMMRTPQGPVNVAINEDSMRDAPRAELLRQKDRVLLMGDSTVEGWWLAQNQTLGAKLTEAFPPTYFINGGLRSTGPLFQVQRFDRFTETYKPRAALLVLNDTDTSDDKLACALSENPDLPHQEWKFGAEEFSQGPWEKRLLSVLGDSYPGRKLKLYFYRQRWNELVQGESAKRCEPCLGIRLMNKIAQERKIPLHVIFFKMRAGGNGGPYELDLGAREKFLTCLGDLKIPFTVLDNSTLTPAEIDRYFWPNDTHRNPEGVKFFVEQISPSIKGWKLVK